MSSIQLVFIQNPYIITDVKVLLPELDCKVPNSLVDYFNNNKNKFNAFYLYNQIYSTIILLLLKLLLHKTPEKIQFVTILLNESNFMINTKFLKYLFVYSFKSYYHHFSIVYLYCL